MGVSLEDGRQVGRALSGRRRGRPSRPLVTAAPPSPTHAARRRRADRSAAPAAPDRQADRQRRWACRPATVSRVLRRLGLSRISDLEPAEPVRRYEREHPGELIHIDIKKLGRFDKVGHRITGDRRRTDLTAEAPRHRLGVSSTSASTTPRASPSARSCPTRRRKAPSPSSTPPSPTTPSLGVTVTRVMTDNGSCYKATPSAPPAKPSASNTSEPSPTRQRPTARPSASSRPALREWAYAQAYPTSEHRKAELPRWLHHYNWHRPHGSLQSQTPISRLGLDRDNLLRLHI